MAKVYEVAFKINGMLSGQFAEAMRQAQSAMKGLSAATKAVNSSMGATLQGLAGTQQRLNKLLADSQRFTQLPSAITKTKADIRAQWQNMSESARAFLQQKNAVDNLKASYNQLKAAVQQSKQALQAEKAELAAWKTEQALLTAKIKAAANQYGRSSEQVKRLKAELAGLREVIASQRANVDSAKAKFDSLKASLKGASTELKAAESALKNLGNNFSASKNKLNELNQTLQRQKQELASLKASLNTAGFSTDHFLQSELKLKEAIAATTREIERQRQVAASLTAAQERVNNAQSNFGDAQSVFSAVTNAAETVAAPFVEATKNAMTFEDAMAKVKSLTQMKLLRNGNFEEAERNMKALTDEAIRLGATTEYTAVQAAEAEAKFG